MATQQDLQNFRKRFGTVDCLLQAKNKLMAAKLINKDATLDDISTMKMKVMLASANLEDVDFVGYDSSDSNYPWIVSQLVVSDTMEQVYNIYRVLEANIKNVVFVK